MRDRPAPRDAAFARAYLAEACATRGGHKSALRLAATVLRRGNYTEEGKAVWRQFLETGRVPT